MDLTAYIKDNQKFQELASELFSGKPRVYAGASFQGYLLAALQAEAWPGRTLLVAAPDAAAAARLAGELKTFAGVPALQLPARGAPWGSGLKPSRQSTGLRHAALDCLAGGKPCILVADIVALMEKELNPGAWPEPLVVKKGGAGFDEIVGRLAGLGYERLAQVEDPGQFSVRGGIIDFFPAGWITPARLEFWGDELESLRSFSPFTQRSLGSIESVVVYAATEPEAKGLDGPGLLEKSEAVIARVDPAAASESAGSFWEDISGQLLPEAEAAGFYFSPGELENRLDDFSAVVFESLPLNQPHRFPVSGIDFGSRKISDASAQLNRLVKDGYRVFVCFASTGAALRAEHGLAGAASVLPDGSQPPAGAGAWLVASPAPAGFLNRELKLAVLGERSLLKPSRSSRSQQLALGGRTVLSFRDLSPGDFVVHEDHGIGIFDSIQTRTVAGITRDYLLLRFKGDDRLFVPQDHIARVSRYIGAGAGSPPLNKLGGRAWTLARARARGAAREMAGELMTLYAVRQSLPGHEFDPDNRWQIEMEASFPFAETQDQAAAIEDVKEDMESPHPMDRLICGDVGYGKTEVALRAAFKAASQGRQVLMLVPTTILALQHYNTFSERFRDYPVNVEMISRFRSQAQSRRIVAGFREGKIDILIGTHRLLSSDVAPHDLGLVIVDEEQRFGVSQKEALRQMRLKVDVLSLSATPIPRTLQMSLAGIRDISVMETPPPGRNPIRTYVGEYNEEMVGEAIRREMKRGGQVFFLHNRVETIEARAAELQGRFPDVRFLVAHGRMPEAQLESVMVAFLSREADVLVCTSIIESGLDIPTANTLIIDHAQLLGLAQLYQIRGRIGRSSLTAHAYLFYPPAASLTSEAMARLSTLSDYTELGSGFKIAMRDLEIRGAGNLLGDEQSGHVAAVGFDMYCDLIRRAVADLKGKPLEDLAMARVEIDADAYIPADYIGFEAARIDMHHRIAAARSEQELAEIVAELEDRFGSPPEVVYNLLNMQEIRLRAAVVGAASVSYRKGRLELSDMRIGAAGRRALEEADLKFAFHPLQKTLVLWPQTGEADQRESLSVVKQTLDVIIDRLLTPTASL